MSSISKIDVLIKDINENISIFEERKEKNKKRAYKLRVYSIISSALVTLLLGLKAINLNLFSNIALFFASLMTVFNGIEGFYNHRGLWYKDIKTLTSLRELKRDLDFSIAGEQRESISIELLTEYKNRLQNILTEDVNTWSKIRENLEQAQDKT
ncbi:DUF4231 domain-containing protein [Bacillus hominis]|uniref:DUF4231 domain-containing protein n=1 Tax=Bacillus hominis TaxID=2817478 RepID=UPI001BB2EE04|nr:DUF4231 domain-containing protein [Bacillus hominis]